jgi:hypothetical protein
VIELMLDKLRPPRLSMLPDQTAPVFIHPGLSQRHRSPRSRHLNRSLTLHLRQRILRIRQLSSQLHLTRSG